MADRIKIYVYKRNGKYYTGGDKWYDIPEGMIPYGTGFNKFVMTHEVIEPTGFYFVVIDSNNNKYFYNRLIDNTKEK